MTGVWDRRGSGGFFEFVAAMEEGVVAFRLIVGSQALRSRSYYSLQALRCAPDQTALLRCGGWIGTMRRVLFDWRPATVMQDPGRAAGERYAKKGVAYHFEDF